MAKQQTKKQKLEELFNQARFFLSDSMFKNWLCFCYGVFEHAAGIGRRINRYDITLIAKELADRRKEVGCVTGKAV